MTVEEQRYYEECRKKMDSEQLNIVGMAIDYGLSLTDIRKVVQSNKKDASCMRAIMKALMEDISEDAVRFLCENDFNPYQIKEITEGIENGLTLEQVKSYAAKEMPANRMRKMRKQLEASNSISQSTENNQRLAQELQEKNHEIQRLLADVHSKEDTIQELKKQICDMKAKRESETAVQVVPLDEKIARRKPLVKDEETVSRESLDKGRGIGQNPSPKATEDVSQQIPLSKDIPQEEQPDKHTEQSRKKRLLTWFASCIKNIRVDAFGKIMEMDLSPEQLEEVRQCLECGLDDQEITHVLKNNPTPERMSKMREILLLMKQRKVVVT